MVKEGIDPSAGRGKWLVTAINEQGRRETVEIDVKPGKVTVTEVNTAEPEEDEDDDQEGGKPITCWEISIFSQCRMPLPQRQ